MNRLAPKGGIGVMQIRVLLVFALLAIAMRQVSAQTASSKLSADVQAAESTAQLRVLIQWTVTPSTVTQAKVQQWGGSVISEFAALKSGVYVLPASARSRMETDPLVAYVSLDRGVQAKHAHTAADSPAPAAGKHKASLVTE